VNKEESWDRGFTGPKGEDLGQSSFVIRSALRDLHPRVPLQALVFAVYYEKAGLKSRALPFLYRASQVSYG
jgi:hypothetical protein